MNWNEIFEYDDGILYWKVKRKGCRASGIAGNTRKDGYVSVRIDKRAYLAHRVIYEMHFGDIDKGFVVDHIDHDPSNNKIENLRMVSETENNRNVSIRKKTKSGYSGVTWHAKSGKWQATVRLNCKTVYLGLFLDAYEAAMVVDKFYKDNGFHENHGR